MASYFHKTLKEELKEGKVAVAAPDIGGVVRARRFALQINADLAIVDKRRSYEVANYCEVLEIIGDVRGKTVVMIDDMIDTAGSVAEGSRALKAHGAARVWVAATHGIFSPSAYERMESAPIEGSSSDQYAASSGRTAARKDPGALGRSAHGAGDSERLQR